MKSEWLYLLTSPFIHEKDRKRAAMELIVDILLSDSHKSGGKENLTKEVKDEDEGSTTGS